MFLQFERRAITRTFLLYVGFFFIINLLQSFFTSIHSDEAYYALWGKHLDWGYFDHPPMIALYNYLSSLFFTGNLGVRFVTVISNAAAFVLIWKTIDEKEITRKNIDLFFIIAASLVMFQALGFITTPDAPLLLFIAIFLYLYKNFLRDERWLTVVLLGLSMAGLVYSKYQSVLLIGFIVLSNLRLIRSFKFWIAAFFALSLLLPHFYWQYAHNFPSLQYHFVDRSRPFNYIYILEYLPNQLVVFNPITFGLLVYVLIKHRWTGVFERGLYFIIIGFVVFFWIMSIRGHVEPHWTVACSIPIIIILYNKAIEHLAIRRFIFRYVLWSLVLVFSLRILLLIPAVSDRVVQYSAAQYHAIHSVAGNVPVVFGGSFQDASLYSFFTDNEAFVISSRDSRCTQFDIWQWDKKHEGKRVFVCAYVSGVSQRYSIGEQVVDGFFTDSYHSAVRLDVGVNALKKSVLHVGDTVTATFMVNNPTSFTVSFNDKTFPVSLCAYYSSTLHAGSYPVVLNREITNISASEKIEGTFYTIVPDVPEGEYQFGLAVKDLYGPSIETENVKISIVK